MRKSVFVTLEDIKQGHSKVRDILHTGLNHPQDYLTNPMFREGIKKKPLNL